MTRPVYLWEDERSTYYVDMDAEIFNLKTDPVEEARVRARAEALKQRIDQGARRGWWTR